MPEPAKLGSARFPRTARLLSAGQFNAVFAERKAKRGQFFTLHQRLHPTSQVSFDCSTEHHKAQNAQPKVPRLGVVVPKKLLRRAVDRNLIKRIVRETFRHTIGSLPEVDLIVRLNCKLDPKREKIDRKVISSDITHLLVRLSKSPRQVNTG